VEELDDLRVGQPFLAHWLTIRLVARIRNNAHR